MKEADTRSSVLKRGEHAALDTAACSPDMPSHWFMIRLSSLGDVALTTGVLAWWGRTRGWTFTVITREAFAPLFARHPAVKQVIALRDEDLPLGKLVPLFRKLAASAGTAGLIDLHGTPRSRLLSLFWKGPVRRFDKLTLERRAFLASGGALFRQRLNTCNIPQRYAGAIEKQVPPRADLLPVITLTPEECAYGERTVSRLAGSSRLVALHPYAAHPDKAWSPHAWNEFLSHLDAEHLAWFVIGRSGEAIRPCAVPPERDFTNKTSLRETCALLKAADALITGDSGPMHLACGVGTPVVALFGPTTSEWGFMPAGPNDQIVQAKEPPRLSCRPCSLHGGAPCPRGRLCMTSITPEETLEALKRLLDATASTSFV